MMMYAVRRVLPAELYNESMDCCEWKNGCRQGTAVGTQAKKTKFWLFVLSTGLPVITGALGILPKFFYPLTGENRDRMYAELVPRREDTAKAVNSASPEELEAIKQQQAAFTQEEREDLL